MNIVKGIVLISGVMLHAPTSQKAAQDVDIMDVSVRDGNVFMEVPMQEADNLNLPERSSHEVVILDGDLNSSDGNNVVGHDITAEVPTQEADNRPAIPDDMLQAIVPVGGGIPDAIGDITDSLSQYIVPVRQWITDDMLQAIVSVVDVSDDTWQAIAQVSRISDNVLQAIVAGGDDDVLQDVVKGISDSELQAMVSVRDISDNIWQAIVSVRGVPIGRLPYISRVKCIPYNIWQAIVSVRAISYNMLYVVRGIPDDMWQAVVSARQAIVSVRDIPDDMWRAIVRVGRFSDDMLRIVRGISGNRWQAICSVNIMGNDSWRAIVQVRGISDNVLQAIVSERDARIERERRRVICDRCKRFARLVGFVAQGLIGCLFMWLVIAEPISIPMGIVFLLCMVGGTMIAFAIIALLFYACWFFAWLFGRCF